ncbi:hypothetical protein GWI33_016809 [Rhynchophorus ferrugineus]|uniref:Uncharacterized protein n=1 Tax=Rhynchophorus ferrugineus TaxID=354439 RepID=A0A834HZC7_RHYFE|nr:hypothetical protein GWI33_016809 [Rhynchophorus ferrugineus]
MEVDQNKNDIEGPQPGCLKQVSSTFERTPEVPDVPIGANKVLRCTVVYYISEIVKSIQFKFNTEISKVKSNNIVKHVLFSQSHRKYFADHRVHRKNSKANSSE